MTERAERFVRDGFIFPVRVLSAAEAARCAALYETFEAVGAIKDDRPGLKLHCAYRWAYDIVTTPAVLDAVEELIGPDILVFASRPWNKKANDVRYVAWHQDNSYYGLDPQESVAMWVALTPSTVENGCVKFVPGSHTWGDQVHEIVGNPLNRLTRGQEITTIDESRAVDAVLQAGEASFHHERTAHGSKGNGSASRRLGIQVNFIPAHVRSTIGRRSALLVRGVDRFGHWDADPVPRYDRDPAGVEANDLQTAVYYANTRQLAKEG